MVWFRTKSGEAQERFGRLQDHVIEAYARKAGYVEYWRAKGWPDLCHPTTGDDFACD